MADKDQISSALHDALVAICDELCRIPGLKVNFSKLLKTEYMRTGEGASLEYEFQAIQRNHGAKTTNRKLSKLDLDTFEPDVSPIMEVVRIPGFSVDHLHESPPSALAGLEMYLEEVLKKIGTNLKHKSFGHLDTTDRQDPNQFIASRDKSHRYFVARTLEDLIDGFNEIGRRLEIGQLIDPALARGKR